MKKIFLLLINLPINHLVNKITNSKLNVITSNFMLCPINSPKLKHILYNEIKTEKQKILKSDEMGQEKVCHFCLTMA